MTLSVPLLFFEQCISKILNIAFRMLCLRKRTKQRITERKSQHYLHPWNNLPQNVVQTSSPQWQAQRPEETKQSSSEQERHCVEAYSTSTCTTGYTLIMQLRSFQEAKELLSVQSLTIQAVLHISAGVLYPEPMRTSKDRYCRVWMSSVKCLC